MTKMIALLLIFLSSDSFAQGNTYPNLSYNWQNTVSTASALPTLYNQIGDTRTALDTLFIYSWNGSSWVQQTGSGSGGSSYSNSNAVPNTVGGITSGTTLTGPFTLQQMFDKLLYPYIAPSISSFSSTPSTGTVREKGNNVTSEALSAVTVKHTNNITSVAFYLDGVLLHTQASPLASGGTEAYTDSTTISANGHNYQVRVGDGTSTTNSSNIAYSFVSAYYWGVATAGICSGGGAGIQATGAHVQGNTATIAFTSSPSSQVFFFAEPSSYPVITSVLDNSGFQTISSYNVTSGISITNSFSAVDTYRCYELNTPTTQTSFTNTFKQ